MATIKSVEVKVEPRIITVEVGGGVPGTPGTDGTDGVSVTGATIDGSGHLILTLSVGGPIDAGVAKGTDGTDGVSITGASVDGSGHLILTRSVGGPIDAGLVVGADGTDGADGRSVTGASIDGSGHLVLTFSSAPSPVDLGDVTGEDGTDGTDGTDGVSVTGASVDGSYHLILTLSDSSTIDAGYVRGPAGAGTGDVIGPAGAVNDNFPAFDTTTGKLIKDSGVSAASFATAAQGTKADSALQSISETGNGISIDNSTPTAPVLSLDATLEAVANFATGANKVMYWTGTDTLGSFDTTAYTRGFMAAADAIAARAALVLGTAATKDTGVAAGNVPVLDGSGLLDASILPALAISDVFVAVDQAAMLALTAQRGDFAIRTDINSTFILSTNSPSTLADWKEILTPTDGITSVAGITTSVISGAALLTALGLNTGDSPQFTAVNLGHATDTTLGRTSAGIANIEGVDIVLVSGAQTLSGKTYASPTLTNAITVESYAFNTSTNAAVDLANGTQQVPTLTGNWAPGVGWPTPTAGQGFRLIVKTGAGSFTITWPSSVKWEAGTAPTITSAASKADIIDFESDGTNWYGYVVGQAYVP